MAMPASRRLNTCSTPSMKKSRAERLTDGAQVKAALRTLLVELLKPLERSMMLGRATRSSS